LAQLTNRASRRQWLLYCWKSSTHINNRNLKLFLILPETVVSHIIRNATTRKYKFILKVRIFPTKLVFIAWFAIITSVGDFFFLGGRGNPFLYSNVLFDYQLNRIDKLEGRKSCERWQNYFFSFCLQPSI